MPLSRAELPEEFYDITSAQLLAQPEPMYLYARLFMAALGVQLNVPPELGMAGRAVGGSGAPYSSAERDRLMLSDDLATQLFAVKANFAGGPGHTIRFNRPQFTNTTYTQESRQIGTNQTVTTVPITADSEQIPLTVKRFGGPYDQANTRVAPYAIDDFDASMGVHDLANLAGTHLKRDFHRTLDAFYVTLSDLGAAIYPEGMTADNDAVTAGQFPLTYEQCNRTSKIMDEANLPVMGDGRRVMVLTPTGKKQLKDDPQFARYAEFHKEVNPLFPGYIGDSPEWMFFLSTTLSSPNNGSGIAVHRAHAIAPGALLGGIGKPPRVAPASDDNYGMTPKVIWVAHLAPGLADNRFVRTVRYSQDA